MNKYYKIFLTLFALFAVVSCSNERVGDLSEESSNTLTLEFGIQDFDDVSLRSHMSGADESALSEMLVWVFDQNGNRTDFVTEIDGYDQGYRPAADGGTGKYGNMGNRVTIKKGQGTQRVVALANYLSPTLKIVDESGKVYTKDDDFNSITTLTQLRKLRVDINPKGLENLPIDRFANLLMYGEEDITSADFVAGKAELLLKPIVAKFTIKITSGSNVEIGRVHSHFENIPAIGTITPDFPMANGDVTFKNSDTFDFGHNDNVFTLDGYLMPNAQQPTKKIDQAAISAEQAKKGSSEAASGFTAFDLRQLQTKTASGNKYTNGDFVYAPQRATSLVFTAEMEDKTANRQGVLTYRINLGDFSGVTNWITPSTTELGKINNYTLESAKHYTYNIKINGFNNVKVEALTEDVDNEPNPSVEGTLIETGNSFQLDSHFEQRTILLSADKFKIFEDGTLNLKPDASVQFMISTPFDQMHVVKYTKAEINKIMTEGASAIKKADNDWIRIFVHSPGTAPFVKGSLPAVLYSDSGNDAVDGSGKHTYNLDGFRGKTLTVEQFFIWVLNRPKELFDTNRNICLTLFFDEYFYEKEPLTPGATQDPTLWKKFANQPDRKFSLLTGDVHVSPDTQSKYIDGVYASFSQYSIKTFFTEEPEGIRVWGLESVNEFPNVAFLNRPPTSVIRYMNDSKNSGWMNTWNLISSGYQIRDKDDPNSWIGGFYRFSKENNMYIMCRSRVPETLTTEPYKNIFSDMTKAAEKGVDMKDGFWQAGDRRLEVPFTAMARNRDINRDNMLQANELKWYIPAQFQANVIVNYDNYLPAYAKLQAPIYTGNSTGTILWTSTCYTSGTKAGTVTSNPIVMGIEDETMMPLYQAAEHGYIPNESELIAYRHMRSTTRMVRDLGMIDYSSIDRPKGYSKYFDEKNYKLEPITWVYFEPNINNRENEEQAKEQRKRENNYGGVFVFNNYLNPNVVRTTYIEGELPTHYENSAANRVYYRGFRLSKTYAEFRGLNNKMVKRIDQDGMNTLRAEYRTPCVKYSEEGIKDLGDWRLPNLAELMIMACGTYDPREFNTTGLEGVTPTNVWSSTLVSGNHGKLYNYSLYVNGYLALPTSPFAPGYGKDIMNRNWEGPVRCVRDLTEEEYNTYKGKIESFR